MCVSYPARVVAIDAAGATVEQDGRRRRASLLVTPDVVPGDWVVVGAGAVLRRLDPAEADQMIETIAAAIAATDAGHVPAQEARDDQCP